MSTMLRSYSQRLRKPLGRNSYDPEQPHSIPILFNSVLATIPSAIHRTSAIQKFVLRGINEKLLLAISYSSCLKSYHSSVMRPIELHTLSQYLCEQ